MKRVDLTQNWRMHEAPLMWTKTDLPRVEALADGWHSCNLPADVRMPLIEAGIINDPVVGDACFESEWIEERSWWFQKTFPGSDAAPDADVVELVLDKLDSRADIFLNGVFLGTHRSVHYPFVYNVKDLLQQGDNTLTVRLTSGLEEITQADMAELNFATCTEYDNGGTGRGDKRRSFVRRPQYTVGWDWGPKIITIGIGGEVFLRSYTTLAVREAAVSTLRLDGGAAVLKATVNVECLNMIATATGDVKVRILKDGKEVAAAGAADQLFTSGSNYFDFELRVENAELWWPAGAGAQPLYDVEVSATAGGSETAFPTFRAGIRTLQLDTSVIEGDDRRFQLMVNGVPVYCKGGNWVPADMIHARVGAGKIRTLVQEAANANFNALRIWGGALYEQEAFYDVCDELGILLLHDFMLACSTVPDHHPWFRYEMRQEMDYQTKRLRSHPSLALFFGSNENHWLFNHIDNPRWGIEYTPQTPYGLYTANLLAKEVIRANCPHVPYWNSSPYGGEKPNAPTQGDVHAWSNPGFMSKEMEERIEAADYDLSTAKFVSEYGYVGPCCLETIQEYMGGAEPDRKGDVWQLHNNVFEKGTVSVGIRKNYGIDGDALSLEDYILYGGMVHGLMFGYSQETYRFKDFCGGGLIWMYNDAWGEQGWTIIDYAARRKIPFYAVKRALAPVKLTLRKVDGQLAVQGINDTPEALSFSAELGYLSFDGKTRETERVSITLPARSRQLLFTCPLPKGDYTTGAVVLVPDTDAAQPAMLRTADMQALAFDKAEVRVVESKAQGGDLLVTVEADAFAHGVYIQGNARCSDNYFDLLPGERRTVLVQGAAGTTPVVGSVR